MFGKALFYLSFLHFLIIVFYILKKKTFLTYKSE